MEQKYSIGDSIKLTKEMKNDSIDFVLTSPPYNIGIDYGFYKDDLPYETYLENMESVIKELYRILKPNRRMVYNVLMNTSINGVMNHPYVDFINILKKQKFNVHGTPLWYDNTRSTHTAWGSWLSISSPYFYNPHEVLIIAYKGNWKREGEIKNTMTRKQFLSMCNGMISFQTESRKKHPAPFSLNMAQTIIECLTSEGDIVFDPFLGKGTVLKACQITNRNGIGIEINIDYAPLIDDELGFNMQKASKFFNMGK